MSSDPNTNDEGPQPPKRPKSQPTTVAKEISDVDFWDLDEESESTADSADATVLPQPRQKSILPRHPSKKAVKKTTVPKVKPVEKSADPTAKVDAKPAEKKKISRMKVGSAPPQLTKRYPSAASDELVSKDLESEPGKKMPTSPEEVELEVTPAAALDQIEREKETAPEKEPEAVATPEAEKISEEGGIPEFDDEPVSDTPPQREGIEELKGKLNLSKVEKIGMGAFVILLLGVAVFFLTQAVYKLPEEPKLMGSDGFPVTGNMFTIEKTETFWRKPIVDGPNPDRVRRGTKLIPVLKISIAEGNGAIRVLFRNADRQLMGDGITREAKGDSTLEIPATAGFEETGMHAAYRTGDVKTWNVEVYEAPNTESSTAEFKKIYEAHISSEQR